MGVYENMIESKASTLNWKTSLLARVASEFGISGASEASLSKAFSNAKDLDTSKTAYPLNAVLDRFIKMSERFAPFKVRLARLPGGSSAQCGSPWLRASRDSLASLDQNRDHSRRSFRLREAEKSKGNRNSVPQQPALFRVQPRMERNAIP